MLINNTIVVFAAKSLASAINRTGDSSEIISEEKLKMQAVNEIINELNILRMNDYMSSDYSSSHSYSMSSDEYNMFFSSFEPIQFGE